MKKKIYEKFDDAEMDRMHMICSVYKIDKMQYNVG